MHIPSSSQIAFSVAVSPSHDTSVDEIMPVPKTAVFSVVMLYFVLQQVVHLIQRKFCRGPFPVFVFVCLCEWH